MAAAALATVTMVAVVTLGPVAAAAAPTGPIRAVGAENEYANVIGQVGGRYVRVSAVESNPNTDPHSFEASSKVAAEVATARLVVQNGVGYDSYMNKIESASSSQGRKVIVAQTLRKLPDDTPNPHLWYSPKTMPLVARAVAADLADIQPAHASYFRANASRFVASLGPWLSALATFRSSHPQVPVATTEPVADYMLQAAGTDDLTPSGLQASIMNGTDPAPQNVQIQEDLFSGHKVKVFVYNQQVTDSLTSAFLSAAKKDHIPVVGVYETMPTPGYSYQSWMLAEVHALTAAVVHATSTTRL
jgi:zinc/manganese transport system substrate-binding protein